jgi:glycosyltransferase involved in cell wall biosynthesis
MTATTFHVLIPAFGPSPFLSETLKSVLAASDEAIIATVVDDGSPGPWVAEATAAAGPRVEYVRLNENLGVAGAFQACADHSRATYTLLLGSDDLLEPTYFDVLRDLFAHFGNVEMLTCAVTVMDGSGAVVNPLADRVKRIIGPRGGAAQLLSGQQAVASLAIGNWLYFPAIAWRTDVLRRYGFRQDMSTVLDMDLELRVLLGGGSLAWSPRRAFRYRRHEASVSSRSASSGERFEEERDVYRWASQTARDHDWRWASTAARLRPTSRLHSALAGIRSLTTRGRSH